MSEPATGRHLKRQKALAKQARVLDPLMRRVIAAGGYEVVTTRNMLVTKPVSAVARMSTLLVA